MSARAAALALSLALAVVAQGCEEKKPSPDARRADTGARDGASSDGDGASSDGDGASGDGDATASDAPAPARFNQLSLEQSGSGSGYLEVPSAAALTGSSFDQLTVSLWVKRRAAASAQSLAIATFDGPGTFSTQLSLTWQIGATTAIALRVPTAAASAVLADPERWHHVAGVFDGPSAQVRLYLDGQLAATARAPQAMTMKNALWIGRYQSARADGWIDELAVFNVALGDAAVAAIYNGGTPRDLRLDSGDYNASAQLSGYYRMGDEVSAIIGPQIRDAAGTLDANVVGVMQLSRDVP
ncbi:MAG: LamG domain-containing protein [Myxococcales bacterium]|nr:LamG domain-containing protein [Myxococcales bacterium]